MATNTNTTTTKGSLGRRISDTVLNLDYGDEQERMRYYEAYAVVINLQLVILPIATAIALLGFGGSATWPILTMFLVWFAPVTLVNGYLNRYGVRSSSIALSRRNRPVMAAYLLGLFALAVAVVVVNRASSSYFLGWNFVLGAAIGMVVVIAYSARRARSEQAQS